ncbi:hypothetical protein MESS4_360042 [Mesorhizobium sp. STM 4661]|nr:hypothetical protein MESS4_360042 [Mesorhizobium sp. STM 4661]
MVRLARFRGPRMRGEKRCRIWRSLLYSSPLPRSSNCSFFLRMSGRQHDRHEQHVCLTYIPFGSGPSANFLAVLRHDAPTQPTLAGAICGTFAGAIAATFYAAQCTDDSPLFVATWYMIAHRGLAVIGAVSANIVARWQRPHSSRQTAALRSLS